MGVQWPVPTQCGPRVSSALSGVFLLGVWPEGSDGTDINAASRAHEKKLLSTGDDFGKVHLFSYPCSQFRVESPSLIAPDRACTPPTGPLVVE